MARKVFIKLVFTVFIILVIFVTLRTKVLKPQKLIVPDSNFLIGMLRTSGLSDIERKVLKIDSQYQLEKTITTNLWDDRLSGIFLIADEAINLKAYLGNCVAVKTTTLSGWEDLPNNEFLFNGKWTYNRSAALVEEIKLVDLDLCLGNFDWTIKDQSLIENMEYLTVKGTLEFINRPAPDISYDLELILDEPISISYGEIGDTIDIKRLDVSPATDEIYKTILSNIGNKVTVSGFMEWGYAESRFLRIDRIEL